jgi:hypothetical protein
MSDVTIPVALISALAGVVGAGIPQTAIVIRDMRQAARERQAGHNLAIRQTSVGLLRAAADLATLVANVQAHRSDSATLARWLEDVGTQAAEATLQATELGLLVTDERAKEADAVATAATGVAAEAAGKSRLDLHDVTSPIELGELNDRMVAFRKLITSWPQLPDTDASPDPPAA